MNATRVALAAVLALAAPIRAQSPEPVPGQAPPPLATFNELACAPFLTFAAPPETLRVIGSQDTLVRQLLGPGDTLVVNAGLTQGLQTGQEFFVRRLTRTFGAVGPDRDHPLSVHTAGWIRLAGVGPDFSTATVSHACEGILTGDYLEPFVPPTVTAALTDGTPRFEQLGRVMVGDEGRRISAVGDLVSIDRGSDHGVAVGQMISVYRAKTAPGPLVEIATVIAVVVRPESSTVRVVQARDAVMLDDLIALRR